ncbi:MAG: hypothetical protein RLY93_15670 [Sumerlaeia bacterium]
MPKTRAEKFFVVLSVLHERSEEIEVPWEASNSCRTAFRVGMGQGMIRLERIPANGPERSAKYVAYLQDVEGRVALELEQDDDELPGSSEVLRELYEVARYSALRGDELLQSVSNALKKNEYQPVTPGTETAIEE